MLATACVCLLAIVSASAKLDGRITNGEIAARGRFKFMAGLKIYDPISPSVCGGVLISTKYVVTAAHCLLDATGVDVILGSINLNARTEPGCEVIQIRNKQYFILHPKYDNNTLKHDIGLIEFPNKINYTTSTMIKPIDLPKVNFALHQGETVTAAGWGWIKDKGPLSPALMYVDSKIMDYEDCFNDFLHLIRASHICIATTNGRSPCIGDSGGPLITYRDGKNVLVGLTSFVYTKGCQLEYPAVFTRVSSYLIWIEDITKIQLKF